MHHQSKPPLIIPRGMEGKCLAIRLDDNGIIAVADTMHLVHSKVSELFQAASIPKYYAWFVPENLPTSVEELPLDAPRNG